MCTRCRIVKSFADFSPNNKTRDGKVSHCKACHRIDCRESRRRKKEESIVEQEIAEARIYDSELDMIFLFVILLISVMFLFA